MKSNQILFVKEHTHDGITTSWFVKSKNTCIEPSREYINYDENGRTISAPYPFERLPKYVQEFIRTHETHLFNLNDPMLDEGYATFIHH